MSAAAATMDTTPARPQAGGGWIPGLALIVCVAVMAGLLTLHPNDAARDFAGMLKEMAAQRTMDAIVHGGAVVVGAVVLLCMAAFSARLGVSRGTVLAALVAYIIGYIAFSGALMTDGLILPAIADRFASAPADTLPVARGLFVLGGTAIMLLMPFGMAMQAVGVLLWACALLRNAVTRSAGFAALLIGAATLVLAGMFGARMFGDPHVVMAILGLLMLWNVVVAILFLRKTV